MPPDADEAALEEERDFLLQSLADLDAELAAGDIDPDDHRTLHAGYTARAAEVLRTLAERGEPSTREPQHTAEPTPERAVGRRVGVLLGVVALAVVAGILVMQSSGRRGDGGLTGLDVTSASSRVDDCLTLEREESPAASLDCLDEVLEAVPGNEEALMFRGWLKVREFDPDDGIEDLDAAIQLDDAATAPYLFRAVGQQRTGDTGAARADLASFFANDPPDEELQLALGIDGALRGEIAGLLLDRCIGGDVSGSLEPVDALSCYRTVLELDPDSARAKVYQGWLLARARLADEARPLLDAGLEEDPSLAAGYVFRSALRASQGDIEGAEADLSTFDELDADPAERAAAEQVRADVAAGRDPLGG